MTNVSKVYFGLSRVSSDDAGRVGLGFRCAGRPAGRAAPGRSGSSRSLRPVACRGVGTGLLGSPVLVELGVDRDRDPDLPAEGDGQGVLELAAQPALELAAGEVVGHGDDRGALVEGHRLAGAQPGALVGLEVLDDAAPGACEVRAAVLHAFPPAFLLMSVPVDVVVLRAADHGRHSLRSRRETAESCRPDRSSPQLCPQAVNPTRFRAKSATEHAARRPSSTAFPQVRDGETDSATPVTRPEDTTLRDRVGEPRWRRT